MHCFIWLTATAALWGCAAAASTSKPNSHSSPLTTTQTRGYEEKDTARGFYSYGYSDENAARAEYTAQDGSSHGFYSYVDANGELQTVKYEAGGTQGFKAVASNQPKAPIDDRKPVTDTAEVQEAREAHLNAIREAQEKERAAAREQQLKQKAAKEDEEEAQKQEEQPLTDEDANILERVRAELTSMLEQRQHEQENRQAAEQSSKEETAEAQGDDNNRKQDQDEQSQRNTNDNRLRTVYTLSDLSSSSYLKLSDLQDRLDREDIPVTAYYSYTSPSAKYSVTTPTKLRALSRPVALSRSLVLSKRN